MTRKALQAEAFRFFAAGDVHVDVLTQLLEKVWDDARSGMVPEGELQNLRVETASLEADIECHEEARAYAKAQHEAELAKAWCAGRDAAADYIGNSQKNGVNGLGTLIRALQPPGGKAK